MGANLSGNSKGRRGRRQMSEINVTPLVDVMLVLLIIFMVAAPMMTTGVTVDLPDSNAQALPGQDEPLSVTVKADGKIYLQTTEIKLEEIAARLDAITREKKDTRIFVRGDRTVDYGRIMRVIGEISGGGFTKVALVTEQKGGEKR